MEHIQLGECISKDKTILIFAEGTVLKPKSWLYLYDHKSYVPIGNCIALIHEWQHQGANIIYCTSRAGKQAGDIAILLKKYGFPGSALYFRSKGEKYKNIIEALRPDVLIEDDCKSIGGAWQMCITNVAPSIKSKILSVVVGEFKGIDHLSSDLSQLNP